MPRLLVIDDRDQTVEMVHRQLPEFDTVTRCDRRIPCQVCEERERGCPLRCAHDYGEAARGARARWTRCPTWSSWTCTSRCPRSGCCPRTSRPCPRSRSRGKTALDGLRRKQGLLILEQLRASYPTLPVVMLTTTGSDLGAERPDRSARLPVRERGGRQPQPGRRDLARPRRAPHRAGGRHLLGTRARDGRAAPPARRAGPLAAAAADRGRDRYGQELPRRAGHPPALGRQGAAGRDRSVDGAAGAAGGAPVRRAARRVHGRRRGSRGRVRAGARRDAVPRRDREPGSRAATAAPAGARARRRSRASATRGRGPRRPSWSPRRTRTSRRWCTRDGFAPISTCASTRRRGCACRRCASGARICPTWSASRSSRRCARSRCGRWCVRTWRSFPRRRTSTRMRTWSCSAGRARRRRAATPSRCSSAAKRWRGLTEHDWPGNHRELQAAGGERAGVLPDAAPGRRRRARPTARARARGSRRPRPAGDAPAGRRREQTHRHAKPTAGVKGAPARAGSRWRCSRRQLRARLRRRRAPVPARAVRSVRRRSRADGAASCWARAAPRARFTCASTSWACACATCEKPRDGGGDVPPARGPLAGGAGCGRARCRAVGG